MADGAYYICSSTSLRSTGLTETILRQTDQRNELHERVGDFLEDTLE
jgi:hypothetical protein